MPTWLAVTLVVTGVPAAALALTRTALVVVTVVGSSMTPTLDHGDRVLVVRRWLRPVRRGDIVAARIDTIPLPRAAARRPPLVIKRAAAMAGEAVPHPARADADPTVPAASVFLLGDNGAASDDSREWGALPAREIVGVMVRRLPRHD